MKKEYYGNKAMRLVLNYIKSILDNMQSDIDGKAPESHGVHVEYSDDMPSADGVASAGSASTVSRSDHVHPIIGTASSASDGLMSASDKDKLDNIEENSNNYVLPTASSTNLGGVTTTSAVTSTSNYEPCPIVDGVPYYRTGSEDLEELTDEEIDALCTEILGYP